MNSKTCPFISNSLQPNGASYARCVDKCALYLNGKCSVAVIAENLSRLSDHQPKLKKKEED
jgi:hypothetical protein